MSILVFTVGSSVLKFSLFENSEGKLVRFVGRLLCIDRKIPPITSRNKSLRTQFEALIKAFK